MTKEDGMNNKRYSTKFAIVVSVFFILIGILAARPLWASSLIWDASTGEVAGYKIYYWEDGKFEGFSENQPTPIASFAADEDVGISQDIEPTVTRVDDIEQIFNLPPGRKIWFSVSAFNSAGESDGCVAVSLDVPPYEPQAQRDIFEPGPGLIPGLPTASMK